VPPRCSAAIGGAPLVTARVALVGALEMNAHVAEEVPELVELDLIHSGELAGVLAVDCKARSPLKAADPDRCSSAPTRPSL